MWNYRVVRKKNANADAIDQKERVRHTYAIHEAYYDKNGHVGAITQDPVEPFGGGKGDVGKGDVGSNATLC
jgi:hypothetical protein